MSYYEDERQRRRPTRDISRRDDYDGESLYSPRRDNRTTTIIKRRDSYDDVDEEITREFSPPGARAGYYRETTVRRSGVRPARARSFDEDRSHDDRRNHGAYAGARRSDQYRDERRDRSRRRRYSSDFSSRSRSRTPEKKDRRKSKVEETLESLGLGGLVGGILGKEAKDRQRSKSRGGRDRAVSETRSERKRSRSRDGGKTREQIIKSIQAAVLAGAGEAYRVRNQPGGFSGEKGKRILTAAFSAGGVDGLINHGKDSDEHRKRDTIGSAIAGIATSRVVNGSRSQSRARRGSSSPDRRRSRSRSGARDLLAGGAVAAAAKKVYDSARSRSRGRSESPSRYTDTSRSPSRSKSRRRSLSRGLARGLSSVGLGGVANKVDPDHDRSTGREQRSRRRNSDDYDDRSGYYDDYRGESVGQSRSNAVNGGTRSVSQARSDGQLEQTRAGPPGNYSLDYGPHHNGDPDTDSDSDLGSSSGEENERKRGKRKLLLTTGLAGVATIHAMNGVYQTYQKRHQRIVAVKEGRISAEEAKKSKNRDRFQDAASIGIAALGVKGAYSEMQEMRGHRSEFNQEQEKMERHRRKRQARRRKEKLAREGKLGSDYATNYSTSMPNLNEPLPMHPPPGGWHQPFADNSPYDSSAPYASAGQGPSPGAGAPHYHDGNPYGNSYAYPINQMNRSPLPPPPVGNDYRSQNRTPRERTPSRGRS